MVIRNKITMKTKCRKITHLIKTQNVKKIIITIKVNISRMCGTQVC